MTGVRDLTLLAPASSWAVTHGAAQLVIPDPQVSSAHLWIGLKGQQLLLVDNGLPTARCSTRRRVSPQTEVPIKPGDVISLGRRGHVQLVVEPA